MLWRAANMAGGCTGIVTQIAQVESKAIYMHCYSDALKLVTSDTIKNRNVLQNSVHTNQVIWMILKHSLRCDVLFHKLKEELAQNTPSFGTLCPMRWTVWAWSLQRVLLIMQCSKELWDEALDLFHDSDTHALIGGVKQAWKVGTALVATCR